MAAGVWNFLMMKKNPKSRRSSNGASTTRDESIAKLARQNLDLLNRLVLAVAANENAQRRFRTAMLIRVSRIETMVQMIHGAQIAETHDCIKSEAMVKHIEAAEQFTSHASDKLSRAMLRFIYDELGATAPQRGRKRQWSDWEI